MNSSAARREFTGLALTHLARLWIAIHANM